MEKILQIVKNVFSFSAMPTDFPQYLMGTNQEKQQIEHEPELRFLDDDERFNNINNEQQQYSSDLYFFDSGFMHVYSKLLLSGPTLLVLAFYRFSSEDEYACGSLRGCSYFPWVVGFLVFIEVSRLLTLIYVSTRDFGDKKESDPSANDEKWNENQKLFQYVTFRG